MVRRYAIKNVQGNFQCCRDGRRTKIALGIGAFVAAAAAANRAERIRNLVYISINTYIDVILRQSACVYVCVYF